MKKKVALVTGGLSSEAQISYKSAKTVMNALDKNVYDVYLIDIHPTGWWYENIIGEEVAVNKADFSIEEGGEKITFDVALIMFFFIENVFIIGVFGRLYLSNRSMSSFRLLRATKSLSPVTISTN